MSAVNIAAVEQGSIAQYESRGGKRRSTWGREDWLDYLDGWQEGRLGRSAAGRRADSEIRRLGFGIGVATLVGEKVRS